MIQKKIEIRKNPPFLITKEKNTHLLTIRASRTKMPNNSLNNFNIIKLNSCINLDSNSKNKNIELEGEETNSSSSMKPGIKFSVGRWTKEEHNNFLKGMKEYGNDWKMLEKLIKTRSRSQIRSHAQKYFVRLRKKVKSQYMKFNAKNLINYVFNTIKKFNGGKPVTVNQRKRALNVIISNFRNFGKDEIESCNMLVNETKIINSQKDGNKSTFDEEECNKSIISEKNDIIIEINNSNIENIKNVQENKMMFCNKKRKNNSLVNIIFKINKVIKYKYTNNFNKINENSNRQIFWNLKKSKIKKSKNKTKSKNKFNHNIIYPIISESYNINNINDNTNNFNNLICNISINNDMSKININFNNKDNMDCFTNNNFNTNNNNNINEFTNLDMNKINFSESLFGFGSMINKINSFDKYPEGVDLNDSLKSIFFEESKISLGEQDNDFSIINKKYDLFE